MFFCLAIVHFVLHLWVQQAYDPSLIPGLVATLAAVLSIPGTLALFALCVRIEDTHEKFLGSLQGENTLISRDL